jgi:hypothetical protein
MRLFMRLASIFAALPARRRSFRFAVLSLLFLAGSSTSSFADLITYTLGVPNTDTSGFPGPYGTVQVNLTDSTHATITFTATPQGGFTYRFGDGQSIDVNVNAATWSVSNILNTDGASIGVLSSQAGGNVDGFGTMNQRFDDTTAGGPTNNFLSAQFTLTNTSGVWGSAANVLTPNGPSGFAAAAHLFVFDSSTPGIGAIKTGFVADGVVTSPVPEPMTVVTLATAIPFGLLALRRRFRGDTPTV